MLADLKEGFRFVRHHVWLWGAFLAATFAYLLFMGPTEVLLPVRRAQHHARGSALLDAGIRFCQRRCRCNIRCNGGGSPTEVTTRRYMTFIYIVDRLDRSVWRAMGSPGSAWQSNDRRLLRSISSRRRQARLCG